MFRHYKTLDALSRYNDFAIIGDIFLTGYEKKNKCLNKNASGTRDENF